MYKLVLIMKGIGLWQRLKRHLAWKLMILWMR